MGIERKQMHSFNREIAILKYFLSYVPIEGQKMIECLQEMEKKKVYVKSFESSEKCENKVVSDIY